MIDDLVQAVGRILDVLDELQLTDYTYVFLTSDNGGTARQYPHFNKPLRAGKGSYYEGGLRVPFFAAGPGIELGFVLERAGRRLRPALDLCRLGRISGKTAQGD